MTSHCAADDTCIHLVLGVNLLANVNSLSVRLSLSVAAAALRLTETSSSTEACCQQQQ